LKPENLGFDVRGDVKLFDFGLAKELHKGQEDNCENYKLSMAGTPRYMAPECGMYRAYNLSADVYSFSMLLWEIMVLEKPLKDFTYSKLKKKVFVGAYRPEIKKVFNKRVKALINAGWNQSPTQRPSMDDMYDGLRAEYSRLTPGNVTAEHMSHKRRRSTFISNTKANNMLSVRNLMRFESSFSL